MEFETLEHYKSVFAHQLYTKPADFNYTLSRWAFFNGYYREFYWQGLQAVEKYCKTILVLNGQSARQHGHDIVELFKEIKAIVGTTLSSAIIAPNEIRAGWFRGQATEEFIRQVLNYGSPDTRYNHLSYTAEWSDIVKMDWLCFNLRRFTINLESLVGENWTARFPEELSGQTYRTIVPSSPLFQVRAEVNIPGNRTESKKEELRDALYAFNFAFRRDKNDLEKYPDQAMLENSCLFLLSEALQSSNRSPILLDGTRWLLEVMRLPNNSREHFQRLL